MPPSRVEKESKFLSWVLRHEPAAIGLTLDAQGWVNIDTLITQAGAHGTVLTRDLIAELVRTSDKQRFAISDDGQRIRANQGHSVAVDLQLVPSAPPDKLFHGTVLASLLDIRAHGLRKMERQFVHLSPDEATARTVAARRGDPLVLKVRAEHMARAGHPFYRSANGVWLTDAVPTKYLALVTAKKDGEWSNSDADPREGDALLTWHLGVRLDRPSYRLTSHSGVCVWTRAVSFARAQVPDVVRACGAVPFEEALDDDVLQMITDDDDPRPPREAMAAYLSLHGRGLLAPCAPDAAIWLVPGSGVNSWEAVWESDGSGQYYYFDQG